MADLFDQINACREAGIDLVIVSVVEKSGSGPLNVGKKMIVMETGECAGTIGGGLLEAYVKKRARDVLLVRKSMSEKYCLSEDRSVTVDDGEIKLDMTCGGKATLYYEFVGPRQYVYVFGGGHCGKALTRVLKPLGFYITVIDSRPEILKGLDAVDKKIEDDFIHFIKENGLRKGSLVVVSTPSHTEDYRVLDEIIRGHYELTYFGMLCSKKKIREYLDDVKKTFGPKVDLTHFYSPVGLVLGNNSPEDIAVSIAAEILEVISGETKSRHMRETLDDPYRYWEH